MSKRKITQQQARRIQASRELRTKSSAGEEKELFNSDSLAQGVVIAHFGKTLAVWDPVQNVHRMCDKRQHLGPVVVGDEVLYEEAVVMRVLPRRTCLEKIGPRGQRTPMAANVDQLLIMIAPIPVPSQTTLDRYLVLAERFQVTPIILINKWDLVVADRALHAQWEALVAIYRAIPYQTFTISTKTRAQWDALLSCLVDKKSVVVGQSGVGKSSFVKALVGDERISIGELSKEVLLGKHTTTVSRLYPLQTGGALIDSPGIREMALSPLSIHDLLRCYPEFRLYIGACQFRNCLHTEHSKGCALWQAAAKGEIAMSRLVNFCQIYASFEGGSS